MSELDFNKIWSEWEYAGFLGEGAFGKVYLAKSSLDGKPVFSTVKLIKIPASSEAVKSAMQLGVGEDLLHTYFEKFKNDLNWELTMFRSVSSESLAEYDAFVLMDNSEGPGWSGYIRSGLFTPMSAYFAKSKPTFDDVVRMGLDISDAISACGNYGMVHGGICPENIMLTDGGKYILKDFGIRRCLKRAGSNLFSSITEDYDAPEVISDGRYTNASDIYSLGMCMAYLAGGRALPKDNNPENIPGIPDNLLKVIKRATSRQVEYRYVNAEDMKADLQKIQLSGTRVRRAASVATALGTVSMNKSAPITEVDKEAAREAIDAVRAQQQTVSHEEKKPVEATRSTVAESAAPSPKPKKKGKRVAAIAAMLVIVAASATALYVLKPWESLQEKDPQSVVDDQKNEDEGKIDVSNDDVDGIIDDTTNDTENEGDLPGQNQDNLPDTNEDTNPGGGTSTDDNQVNGGTVSTENGENGSSENTGVTPDQIRLVQKYLGVTVDGDWGPISKTASGGLTAEEAYAAYLNGSLKKPETPEVSGITVSQIKEVQSALGVAADGVWGSKSTAASGGLTAEEAYNAYKNGTLFSGNSKVAVGNVKKMQTLLGVTADGIWGPKSSAACGGLTVEQAYAAYLDGTLQKVDSGSTEDPGDTGGNEDDEYERKVQPYRDITILPTNEREITYADLEGMSSYETYMVINEIYARYGKIFTSTDIQEYFESMYWYEPVTFSSDKVVAQFTELEQANMRTVVAFQREMGYR